MTSSPLLMGIVNVTPDSFSDGGAFLDPAHAIAHGLRLVADGAAILDLGAESTRPGAEDVPAEIELARLLPVVKGLVATCAVPISVDTRKPAVARATIDAGAAIWNDVSALTHDPKSLDTAVSLGRRVVLMHSRGTPMTMQNDPRYGDVVEEVRDFLAARMAACIGAGLPAERIIVDPGIGFGKSPAHNVALINGLSRFRTLGAPVLLGASRKRFIAVLDRDGPAAERVGGSIAAALAGARQGASILRVHDVAATRQALLVDAALARPLREES